MNKKFRGQCSASLEVLQVILVARTAVNGRAIDDEVSRRSFMRTTEQLVSRLEGKTIVELQ